MRYLLLVILLFIQPQAFADTFAINLGGWSTHIGQEDKDFNSNHKVMIFEVGPYLFGRFTNSYYRTSYIAAYGFTKEYEDFKFSLHAGVVKGYRGCYGDYKEHETLCPALIPSVTYTKYKVQPVISLMGNAAVFTLRIPIK